MRQRLRLALREALRTRDAVALAALRSAIGAIDDAEAVDAAGAVDAGPRLGVGVQDVPRRELSDREIAAILRAEITSRESAAVEYERMGRPKPAARLRAEALVLGALLTAEPGDRR